MPDRSTLFWKFYGSALAVCVLSVVCLAFLTFHAFERIEFQSTKEELEKQAVIVESMITNRLSAANSSWIDELCKRIGGKSSVRITVMLPSGEVVGDSEESLGRMQERMRQRSERPEIKAAAQGEVSTTVRRSLSLDKMLLYVIVPVKPDSEVIGMIRAAAPIPEPGRLLQGAGGWVGLIFAGLVAMSALLSLRTSRRIHNPIAKMREGAAIFAGGDLHHRVQVEGPEEVAQLAQALNKMASELHEKLSSITRQRNELEALLSAMMEAVLVLDTQERLMRMNKSAETLFGLHDGKLLGRNFLQVIRNTDLHEFVKKSLASDTPVEAEIRILGDPDKFLRGHGTTLTDSEGRRIGALVVLHDVSRLKALEQIRKDFVANVSHELRTPITSIKGYLETLKEGAINDTENAVRFLDTIIKHTNRLSMIIDELLSLSRIEKEADRAGIKLEEDHVCPVLEAAVKACAKLAETKKISLSLTCDGEATARINANLLGQAVVNLLDNAIKYSDPGSCVSVTAGMSSSEVIIQVTDQGRGIPKESLNRIFERFYRVDKGRSRDKGGIGIGLSIVKHIVNAHRGRIEVKSSPGAGSRFSIYLPSA